jgi:hypothetical protein
MATVARLGLGIPGLYIRRGQIFIRDRQEENRSSIISLPLGVIAAITRPCRLGSGLQGHLSKVHDNMGGKKKAGDDGEEDKSEERILLLFVILY